MPAGATAGNSPTHLSPASLRGAARHPMAGLERDSGANASRPTGPPAASRAEARAPAAVRAAESAESSSTGGAHSAADQAASLDPLAQLADSATAHCGRVSTHALRTLEGKEGSRRLQSSLCPGERGNGGRVGGGEGDVAMPDWAEGRGVGEIRAQGSAAIPMGGNKRGRGRWSMGARKRGGGNAISKSAAGRLSHRTERELEIRDLYHPPVHATASNPAVMGAAAGRGRGEGSGGEVVGAPAADVATAAADVSISAGAVDVAIAAPADVSAGMTTTGITTAAADDPAAAAAAAADADADAAATVAPAACAASGPFSSACALCLLAEGTAADRPFCHRSMDCSDTLHTAQEGTVTRAVLTPKEKARSADVRGNL